MRWTSHPVTKQLPLLYRVWAMYLRHGPRRSNGSILGGSAGFRTLRRIFENRCSDSDSIVAFQSPECSFRMAMDLLDFETFNHTLDLWLSGSDEANLLHGFFERGSVFLDVGANAGFYSLLAASLGGPGTTIHAFEPQERARRSLEKSIACNSFKSITPHPYLVSSVSGTGSLFLSPSGSSGTASMSAEAAAANRSGPSVACQMVSLDDFVRRERLDRVDWIKIDVEGFEADVLRGASDVLERSHPFVWYELNPPALRATGSLRTDDCEEILRTHDYVSFLDVSTVFLPMPRPITRSEEQLINVFAVPRCRLDSFEQGRKPQIVRERG